MSLSKETAPFTRLHLRVGWWSLLLFAIGGIGLEFMHGFKVAWFLDVGMETRRLVWRLAHAHGVFLGIVHIAFAATLSMAWSDETGVVPRWLAWASRGLIGASVAMPAGFLLGGFDVRGGDPGLGVFLLPLGAALLVFSLFLIAWGMTGRRS